jgi:hypothetical protein
MILLRADRTDLKETILHLLAQIYCRRYETDGGFFYRDYCCDGDELEQKIAAEKLAKPKISEEFIRYWFKRFQHLDTSNLDQRKMLINTFVNSIYLFDDKAIVNFNYKDGTETINFSEVECALKQRASLTGSDLEILSPPL